MGGESFFWALADRQVQIGRGEIADADATLTGAPTSIASLVYGGRPLDVAIADGDIAATGDLDLIRALPGFFPLPQKASDRIS